MTLTRLASFSLRNRLFTSVLTASTIALSVFLLLGVERVRTETREGFTNTISGTDLIVGARSGPIQLLLYSVFHIGNATNNISWESVQDIKSMRGVEWVVPLSLGDSHRGYRVVGTTEAYFERFRYARDQALRFESGRAPKDLYEAAVGAEVARSLGYRPGAEIVIAHGTGSAGVLDHDDKPFVVSGVLAATGTPVDRSVIVSLEAIEAIHVGWERGVPMPGRTVNAEQTRAMDLTPEAVTALLVGLTAKIHTFKVQRAVNEYPAEPLLAVLPGVALQELWGVMSVAEGALLAVSVMVVLVGVSGMMTALLTGLNERRREIAVLRSVGARPIHVMALLVMESALLTVAGIVVGILLLYAANAAAAPLLESRLGIHLSWRVLSFREWIMIACVFGISLAAAVVPGYRAYRYSLADGLSIRI